ncbi:MAG: outer membrane beta-barrel protein [Roseiarcus sp.]|jgi:outer membrane immunogenic protein|uniref:outer membrane protein n=1 Tax=Roseiarcus sp. TaxID=1969460 RepID=UPI003C269A3A
MSITRSLALASVALCAVASAAAAADLPTMKGPPPAPVASPFSWTGFDVGLQGGYGWGAESDDLSVTSFGFTADHFTANSPFGGAHVGYDQQFGSFVIGARAELDGFDLHGATAASNGSCYSEGCTVTLAFHNTWQAFLLARAGVAFDRWLVYVTGGLAVGDDRESATITQTNGGTLWSGSQTQTLTGGAIGLGAEYAFDAHWRLGAEWRYVDFPKSSGFSADGVPYSAGFNENLALVSLSYGF